MVQLIKDKAIKKQIAREILESLPKWFGIEEAREDYIAKSAEQFFFAAFDKGQSIGFLTLNETGKDTGELAVMVVKSEYHRCGIGRALVMAAKEYGKQKGLSFMLVKAEEMGRYEIYDKTNEFYLSQGIKELEVFTTRWDERNPCQIYIMSIAQASPPVSLPVSITPPKKISTYDSKPKPGGSLHYPVVFGPRGGKICWCGRYMSQHK